jgi:hypothetical protein
MMMTAIVSYERNADEPAEYRGRTEQMYRDFKRLTAQCLMLTDWMRSSPYMLEMFIFYLMAELKKSPDAQQNTMLGVCILVRQAIKSGYHRDSKYFSGLSLFQGEMRRRVWCSIKQADLRISAQFGLPPMIRTDQCNTDPPRNLYDDELEEDMTELPASRAMSEPTPMAYLLYKSQIVDVTYEIVELTQSLHTPSYEKAMELDGRLRAVHDNIPPQYKFRPVEDSLSDSSDMTMKRYILEVMFLKHLLLLHRKFCSCTRYPYSARTGLESALDILRHQQALFNECQRGRRLAEAKVFVTSLTSHDYLLAAMIVAISLYRIIDDERSGRSPVEPYDPVKRLAMMTGLEGSLRVWESQQDNSMEALKATGIISALLTTLRNHEMMKQQSSPSNPSPFTNSPFSTTGSNDDPKLAEHSAAMTLNLLSSGAMTSAAPTQNLFSTTSSIPNLQYDSAPSATNQTTTAIGNLPHFAESSGSGGIPFMFGSSSIFQPLDVGVTNSLDWVSLLVTFSRSV